MAGRAERPKGRKRRHGSKILSLSAFNSMRDLDRDLRPLPAKTRSRIFGRSQFPNAFRPRAAAGRLVVCPERSAARHGRASWRLRHAASSGRHSSRRHDGVAGSPCRPRRAVCARGEHRRARPRPAARREQQPAQTAAGLGASAEVVGRAHPGAPRLWRATTAAATTGGAFAAVFNFFLSARPTRRTPTDKLIVDGANEVPLPTAAFTDGAHDLEPHRAPPRQSPTHTRGSGGPAPHWRPLPPPSTTLARWRSWPRQAVGRRRRRGRSTAIGGGDADVSMRRLG